MTYSLPNTSILTAAVRRPSSVIWMTWSPGFLLVTARWGAGILVLASVVARRAFGDMARPRNASVDNQIATQSVSHPAFPPLQWIAVP